MSSASGYIAGRDIYIEQVAPSIRDLRELIDSSNADEETKERFRNQLDEYEKVAEEAATGALQRQQQEFELALEQQRVNFQTARIERLFDRDLVSVIIGGVLLIIITIALIIMMAYGKIEVRLIESAFLILLGFFFGQGISRSRGTTSSEEQ